MHLWLSEQPYAVLTPNVFRFAAEVASHRSSWSISNHARRKRNMGSNNLHCCTLASTYIPPTDLSRLELLENFDTGDNLKSTILNSSCTELDGLDGLDELDELLCAAGKCALDVTQPGRLGSTWRAML